MKQYKNGFTIVELLIVIVVIGILAAITIVAFNGIQTRAKTMSVQSDLAALQKGMLMYRTDVGTLPLGADWYGGTTPTATWSTQIIAGLRAGKYIGPSGLEKDPWDNYYWFDNNDCTFGQSGSSPIKSMGPDGVLNTSDDIGITIRISC